MTTISKSILGLAVIGAILGSVAFFGFSPFGKEVIQQTFGSPVGTTFNSAKIVSVEISPATQAATSSSILNTDASARWIADFGFAGCTGAGTSQTLLTGTGLANLVLQAATTSVPNQGLLGNTNYAMNMNVSTSSAVYTASATSSLPSQAGYWAPGTYMTFSFNATNTAACIVELDYIAS